MPKVIDKVLINASANSVETWLREMSMHYLEWHPRDHIKFKVLEGPALLALGSVAYAEERVGRFTLRFRFRVTKDVPGAPLQWRALFPHSMINLRGSFEIRDAGNGDSELIAVTSYGWRFPVLGPAFDWTAERWIKEESLIRHMREEGLYAKAAIEGH